MSRLNFNCEGKTVNAEFYWATQSPKAWRNFSDNSFISASKIMKAGIERATVEVVRYSQQQ